MGQGGERGRESRAGGEGQERAVGREGDGRAQRTALNAIQQQMFLNTLCHLSGTALGTGDGGHSEHSCPRPVREARTEIVLHSHNGRCRGGGFAGHPGSRKGER